MEGGCGRYAHADLALLASRGAVGPIEAAVEGCECCARALKQGSTGIGQLNAARLAPKQLDIELAFDRVDLPAERRLLYAEPFFGPRDVPFLGDRDEIAELSQLHCYNPKGMSFDLSILYLASSDG